MSYTQIIESKFYLDKSEFAGKLSQWRFQQKKMVFTNGCFDIVHFGHIDYLSKAADKGDVLIVGLNSDASVRKLKGENRPVIDQIARGMLLSSLVFVDAVVLFNEETPANLIEYIKPNVLIKGSDYNARDIVGYDFVINSGGEVVTIDLVEGYSTSNILKKINSQF